MLFQKAVFDSPSCLNSKLGNPGSEAVAGMCGFLSRPGRNVNAIKAFSRDFAMEHTPRKVHFVLKSLRKSPR
jgi:hypothetical protein